MTEQLGWGGKITQLEQLVPNPVSEWMKEKWFAYPNELITVATQAIIVHQWYIQAPGISRRNQQDKPAGTACPPPHQWMKEKWYACLN